LKLESVPYNIFSGDLVENLQMAASPQLVCLMHAVAESFFVRTMQIRERTTDHRLSE